MMIPFRLMPHYKDYVWGGKKLRPDAPVTAEAWIVFEENTIADGKHAGLTLNQLVDMEGETLLGSKVFSQTGTHFPLLIKLLDCEKWLSLQVHPDNIQAQQISGTDLLGKTEAWYVIEAEENAQLISGFRPNTTREDIRKTVGSKAILDLVEYRNVQSGDAIFINPGTIHALGPGLLIYEVQQNSDITYRVYDWDRPMDGNRKLHIDESIQVLNPENKEQIITHDSTASHSSDKELFGCEYFTLSVLQSNTNKRVFKSDGTSFSVITALDHPIEINGKDWSFTLSPLETLFIPANCKRFSMISHNNAKALYTYC
jgi:mannose-6-phosphate isomerase